MLGELIHQKLRSWKLKILSKFGVRHRIQWHELFFLATAHDVEVHFCVLCFAIKWNAKAFPGKKLNLNHFELPYCIASMLYWIRASGSYLHNYLFLGYLMLKGMINYCSERRLLKWTTRRDSLNLISVFSSFFFFFLNFSVDLCSHCQCWTISW